MEISCTLEEAGNYTVTGSKHRHHVEFGHSEGTLSSGFLQEKVWVTLVTSLLALQEELFLSHQHSKMTSCHSEADSRQDIPDRRNYMDKGVRLQKFS
ncbi:hypothetical protein P7K49_037184 [Saguinus oedipus]|uniref:Uncharacterized protein n=1 Tax=Saguinus oedipus TaxID=9490 RepID=A0ABQ9THE5_SAGOE|nr:hypothetical protein P7K49_037184 [Saguinus oedipus]